MFFTLRASIATALFAISIYSQEGLAYDAGDDAVHATKWAAATARANHLIAKLNLTEKASMVTGTANGQCIGNIASIERVGFGGLCLSDGPQGLHLADLASVFPSGLTAAATWDRDLIARRGAAMGAEFRGKGANVMLGPSTGPLGRSPWGGRNWEGFSPDPYLSGVAMQETIRSAQALGVQACAKHFIGNEQETHRTSEKIKGVEVAGVSANIDDRTLHELYLWPFADAVKAGVASFMCSYNRVNMTYSCENAPLLKKILRDELGFQGYMMSDWFATHSGARAINAGLDLNMPGYLSETDFTNSYFGPNVVSGVQNGTISELRLNQMIKRILTPYFYFNQDTDYPSIDPSSYAVSEATYGLLSVGESTPAGRDVRGNHSTLIREMGSAGTVLLKNVNNTLPLKSPKVIGVFGNDAPDVSAGLLYPSNNAGFKIGTLTVGGGSGSGRNPYVVSPLDAIKARAEDDGSRVVYLTDNDMIAEGDFKSIYPWPDICLVFLKTWVREGIDRTTLEADWNSTQVVNNVASICPGKTVVVTHTGGVNSMPWANNDNVTAILAAHYPGQESGHSIVDVLWGDVNPSGKLPYTIAKESSDYNTPILNVTGSSATDSAAWQVNFTEGLMIDYRHFDNQEITPLYEFGYGLSYTSFNLSSKLSVRYHDHAKKEVSALSLSNKTTPIGGNSDLWNKMIEVTTTVGNTGNVSGATVVQLYLSYPTDSMPSGTPVKVLRGFEKVTLDPGARQNIRFSLRRRDLSFWDTEAQQWRIPHGRFHFSVGFSSRDLPSSVSAQIL
ncbi:hypothetical protein PENANT_c022G05922 [Penicillium antarcticum]|uniref:Probable beta-glucosidase G n=1 Tax=Penicillium antarcticum TaxID=416450 RepID=A0A1V6Q102_9EURO|nr:uncharacterized protein N7508_002825 [Penicillium antarcticum]KAJ5311995.1 hypothetical protein N7508_002825 [Penicillium antarcticum]OQD82376.1 hypothetical protein PENANT_c022G05922 [Penicillium antarcticum]